MASWLGAQPGAILSARKETMYFTDFANRKWSGPGAEFVNNIPRSLEAFEAEFERDSNAPIRIEASTDNLSCYAAAENIARFIDERNVDQFWIVAILRDPVERIVSEFEHTLRLGWQHGSLLESLYAEKNRIANGWHPLFWHIRRSRYNEQLVRYRKLFGDHLFIMDFHRLGEIRERMRLLRWIGFSEEHVVAEWEHQNQRSVLARPGAVRFVENDYLRLMGRALVPKFLRPGLRRALTGPPVDRYRPSDEEYGFIQEALADEVAACIDAEDIPTEHWGCSTRTFRSSSLM